MQQAMQVLTSRKTVSWYTPPWVIDMVREVLGAIDLDPASAPLPQSWIQAETYYALDLRAFVDDPSWNDAQRTSALRRLSRKQLDAQPPWLGRVFLNSPFDDTPAWTDRLRREYESGNVTAAIQLCNSNLGYAWYERLWHHYPVCCLTDRIHFIDQDGKRGGQSKQGQTLAYYGKDIATFARVFGDIGRIILADERHRA